ncbi:MAG: PDZ domain-containing protein [Rubritalea sp.]|uniref:S1C family serine protease n=1 Tax=Rubritalea sp. TaxID=2109375 RepID=UPI0032429AB7
MNKIFSITSLVAVVLSGSGYAIERLTPIQEPEIKHEQVQKEQTAPKVWLGVAGQPIKPALAAQLSIAHGVTVELVAGDGAAAKSGIKKFDIITKIGDKKIKGMNDLRTALNGAEIDQTLDVEVFTSGKKVMKKVKLEARPEYLPKYRPESKKLQSSKAQVEVFENLPELFQQLPDAYRLRVEEMMLSQVRQLENQFAQMDIQMADLDQLKKKVKSVQLDFDDFRMKGNSNYSGTFTMMDDQGSIRFKVTDESGRQVEVKDRCGKVLYSGPYETAEDMAAVPAGVRARIDALGLGGMKQENGFQFQFGR